MYSAEAIRSGCICRISVHPH